MSMRDLREFQKHNGRRNPVTGLWEPASKELREPGDANAASQREGDGHRNAAQFKESLQRLGLSAAQAERIDELHQQREQTLLDLGLSEAEAKRQARTMTGHAAHEDAQARVDEIRQQREQTFMDMGLSEAEAKHAAAGRREVVLK